MNAALPDQVKRLEVFLTVEEHRDLKALAAIKGVSLKDEAALAIRLHVGKAKAELRDVLLP